MLLLIRNTLSWNKLWLDLLEWTTNVLSVLLWTKKINFMFIKSLFHFLDVSPMYFLRRLLQFMLYIHASGLMLLFCFVSIKYCFVLFLKLWQNIYYDWINYFQLVSLWRWQFVLGILSSLFLLLSYLCGFWKLSSSHCIWNN